MVRSDQQNPSPSRRRRNSISRAEIVRAAIDLVESEGLAALTMRRVSERIGSSTMAVYGHVADRDALLVEMLEQVYGTMPLDATAADPYGRVEERMIAAHDFFTDHLWVPRLMTRGDLLATSSLGFADRCIGDFIDAGMAPAEALFSFGECWHLMLGELLDRHPDDLGPRPTQRERVLLDMNTDAYPHYAHVLGNLDPLDGPPADRFPEAIAIMLAGINAIATTTVRPPGLEPGTH